jgi:heptosyltransferase I
MRESLSEFAHIGIIRLSAVGDIILCASMVDALAKTRPLWRISWFTAAWVTDLFKFPDNVKIIPTSKPQTLRDYWRFHQLQKSAPQFDIMLALQASLRINLLCGLIPSKCTLGFDKTRGREGHQWLIDYAIDYENNHLLDGFLQFLTALHLTKPPQPSWPIHLNPTIQEWAERQLPTNTDWIAINLRASKTERNWPLQNFQQLITQLLNSHDKLAIVLTGGDTPDEQQSARQLLRALNQQHLAHRVLNQVGRTTLPQLAALLKRCQGLIAPDTGPVHLARALNIPVIGLYAVARSALTGPYHALDYCIDRHAQAVKKYGKKQQTTPWHYRVHDARAMKLITVEAVKQKMDLLFAQQTLAAHAV